MRGAQESPKRQLQYVERQKTCTRGKSEAILGSSAERLTGDQCLDGPLAVPGGIVGRAVWLVVSFVLVLLGARWGSEVGTNRRLKELSAELEHLRAQQEVAHCLGRQGEDPEAEGTASHRNRLNEQQLKNDASLNMFRNRRVEVDKGQDREGAVEADCSGSALLDVQHARSNSSPSERDARGCSHGFDGKPSLDSTCKRGTVSRKADEDLHRVIRVVREHVNASGVNGPNDDCQACSTGQSVSLAWTPASRDWTHGSTHEVDKHGTSEVFINMPFGSKESRAATGHAPAIWRLYWANQSKRYIVEDLPVMATWTIHSQSGTWQTNSQHWQLPWRPRHQNEDILWQLPWQTLDSTQKLEASVDNQSDQEEFASKLQLPASSKLRSEMSDRMHIVIERDGQEGIVLAMEPRRVHRVSWQLSWANSSAAQALGGEHQGRGGQAAVSEQTNEQWHISSTSAEILQPTALEATMSVNGSGENPHHMANENCWRLVWTNAA